MSGLPVSSIPQCHENRHDGAWLEVLQVTGRLEPSSIEAHQAVKMICNVRSLKLRIKSRSFLEEILTSSNEVFKDSVSDKAVELRMLGILTGETAENNDIVKQTLGYLILTLQLRGK